MSFKKLLDFIKIKKKNINWLKTKLWPYFDLLATIFLDACLILSMVWSYSKVSFAFNLFDIEDSFRQIVDIIKSLFAALLIVTVFLYVALDMFKVLLKCLGEAQEELRKFKRKRKIKKAKDLLKAKLKKEKKNKKNKKIGKGKANE